MKRYAILGIPLVGIFLVGTSLAGFTAGLLAAAPVSAAEEKTQEAEKAQPEAKAASETRFSPEAEAPLKRDAAPERKGAPEEKPAPKAERQPSQNKNAVVAAAEEFTQGFSDEDRRHFNVLYGNYNLVKIVETVQDDVGTAVKKCGEANADMKEPLDKRYDEWRAAIKPVMAEAEANLNNMVFAQDYAQPKKIRKFFKLIDDAREKRDAEVEKVPVTSKEACEYLLKTMDSTQQSMISLLRATLVSLPQIMQLEQERKNQEQKAAPKKKAEEQKPAEAEKSEQGL